jgi:hypothetical protein
MGGCLDAEIVLERDSRVKLCQIHTRLCYIFILHVYILWYYTNI